MPVPDAVVQHYERQQRLSATAVLTIRQQWRRLRGDDLDREWSTAGPRLFATVATAQRAAAADGIAYVPQVLEELDLDAPVAAGVVAAAHVGIASDGRPLDTLLHEPVIRVKELIGAGAPLEASLAAGLSSLERITLTQLADAARGAAGVSIAARPALSGYVRMLNLPSCSRCVVLAGKYFKWNAGFARHPRCDCRHIPATEDLAGSLTTDPRKAVAADQVTGLSRADRKAIDDGADVAQVINAQRGMRTANLTGRRLKTTTVGARRGTPRRLRPESIYREAADRDDALRLLRRFGYLD